MRLSETEFQALIGRQVTGKAPAAPRRFAERTFQAQVIELARLHGWEVYHTHDSRRSDPGWPDLALCRPERPLILAELKSQAGKVSVPQAFWLTILGQATTVEVRLWRPSDWTEITELLKP